MKSVRLEPNIDFIDMRYQRSKISALHNLLGRGFRA